MGANSIITKCKTELADKLNEQEPGRYSIVLLVADEKESSVVCDSLVNSDEDLMAILSAVLRGLTTGEMKINRGPKYKVQ